ncbi:hypothetical protein GRS96_05055 [Rathayibacter sp. VKM Ac-2803]|uniref:hypothetical protein n=1 Tax=unclassified Rathayibacter TaxID=2609250 RepID=UPI0013592E73|nr:MULTISPECIES: hypothetical protein [unclassified Rathayibacter]MWV48647.1 hypothetical protein [Rathayibacter sp. VKM Ac-2803]MWV60676.1 hypothetical protein [Rathayibacter sp. VKM Ac-2754]
MTELSVPAPDSIRVQVDPSGPFVASDRSGVRVALTGVGHGLRIDVAALAGVARVALRWHEATPSSARVLGDAWERSYGELEWCAVRPERVLPWTALVADPVSGVTRGFGVEVRGGAFAFWQVDPHGVTLTLDLRSGGAAVRPGDRAIHAATVRRTTSDAGAFRAQQELMRLLCADPLDTAGPLVGANNWYYAYGRDFGLDAVVRDARLVADLAGDHAVRPFGVIDDGWSLEGTADGLASSPGPWRRGRPREFPDMAAAAAAIREEGVRPGVWFRPLLTRDSSIEGARAARDGAIALDPSSPAVLELVTEDFARLSGWGFELIKHDFSTYDLLGQWGPEMGASPGGGPALHDPSATTAEALVGFYRAALAASGDAMVLGCDVVGHLAAGLVHAQRIGDDTSGLDWDRTRRVGVNTIAFRLAQHGAFFTADPDCVASTPGTDWELNRRFLDLVARSGTALFVSVDPSTRSAAVDDDLAAALRIALDGGAPGGVEPVDWLDSPTPSTWCIGGESVEYDWLEAGGADPFEPFVSASPEA